MNKYIYRASFGLLALSMGGCASLPFMGGGQSPSPTASASPTTTATNNTASPSVSPSPGAKSPAPNDPKASPSPNAKKSPLPTPATQATTAPGIILSTNPEERLLANNRVGNRNTKAERNPFDYIPNIPAVKLDAKKVEETPQLPKTTNQTISVSLLTPPSPPARWQPLPPVVIKAPLIAPRVVNTTTQVSNQPVANNPATVKPQTAPGKPGVSPVATKPVANKPVATKPVATKPVATKPGVTQIALLPAPAGNVPSLPVLDPKNIPQWEDPNKPPPVVAVPQAPPPPPDTSIAENIEVSGIVKVGTQKQIIVKVPTEATSRYVKEGQKLANGEVLVKIIDINDQEPSVTFVQNGVDIVRQVGEKPMGAEEKANNFNS